MATQEAGGVAAHFRVAVAHQLQQNRHALVIGLAHLVGQEAAPKRSLERPEAGRRLALADPLARPLRQRVGLAGVEVPADLVAPLARGLALVARLLARPGG